MGCGHSLKHGTLHHFAISLLILMIIAITQFIFFSAEGRLIANNKPIGYAKIGSRPPKCERRCNTCGHCEAIQVPTTTTPHEKGGIKNSPNKVKKTAYYGRGDDYSNYKPLSWKCKCGDLIFNP